MKWHPITLPENITRDGGCGMPWYGAQRGNGVHEGYDIKVIPGQDVYSPIDGFITREGDVYSDSTIYKLIEIKGDEGITVKIMYATADFVAAPVAKGDRIGVAQKITDRYPNCGMNDHLHIAVFRDGLNVDPESYLFDKGNANQLKAGIILLGLILYKWKG